MAASGELGEAVALFNAGRLGEALARARALVAANPKNAVAYSLCAAIHSQQGDHAAAAADLRSGLKIEPRNAPMLNNLGFVLRTLGQSREAADALRDALRVRPDYPEAHNNLALALLDIDRWAEAAESARRAITLKPGYADAHNNLANALRRMNDGQAAVESYRAALAISPDHAGYHNNLARTLVDLGKPDQAAESFRQVIRLKPADGEARFSLGAVLIETGDRDAAENALRAAISINPAHGWAHFALGQMLDNLGRGQEGFAHILAAAAFETDNLMFAERLAAVIPHVKFGVYDERAVAAIERLLMAKTLAKPADLMPPLVSLLRCRPAFAEALTRAGDLSDNAESICGVLREAQPFLLAASLSHIADVAVENLLTRLRRALLLRRREFAGNEDVLAVAAALALHGFANEYVFFETVEEKAEIVNLERELAQAAARRAPDSFLVACLAAYRPLDDYPWAKTMAPPAGLEGVFCRQIVELAEERRVRDLTPQLRSIVEETSEKVRDQYEQNPYPRWTNMALPQKAVPLKEFISRRRLDVEISAVADRPEVLIAGCGTGQHALMAASTYLDCSVLAIDLSRASLARAQRKAMELGIKNVAFMQADILDLALTERRFDVIECIGVLHHLADPLAGWCALKERMKPDGVMKVGLYSERARSGVWAARRLIVERGLEAGAHDDIRTFRHAVLSGEIGAFEGREAVIATPEFYSTSECRDLVFHVSEKTFTIESVRRALDELGLRFMGFELPSGVARAAFESEHGAEKLRDLGAWEVFEKAYPSTFAGMYILWCALR